MSVTTLSHVTRAPAIVIIISVISTAGMSPLVTSDSSTLSQPSVSIKSANKDSDDNFKVPNPSSPEYSFGPRSLHCIFTSSSHVSQCVSPTHYLSIIHTYSCYKLCFSVPVIVFPTNIFVSPRLF